MPTTVVERFGSLSATSIGKEPPTAFGTPVTPTASVPMTGNALELDPGLFSPKVMMGQRDLNIYPLYGQFKNAGALNAPLFPSMGIMLLAGAIGQDAAAGNGVTGTGSTSPNTLSGGTSAGATTVTLTSAAGYSIGSIVQIDVNASGPPVTTAEIRKVTAVSTNTLTLDQALTYAHLANAPTKIVTGPYTHTITQANTLPSFTIEKRLGDGASESLQFSGTRINKYDLSVQTSNQEAAMTCDLIAKHAAVLPTPSALVLNNADNPYVFAEASLNIFGQAVTQASQVDLSIENGLKETYTMNNSHELQFLSPLTLKVSAKVDLVFTSLDDPTWGYWSQMVAGNEGALGFTLAHPANAGSVALNAPRVRIRTNSDAIKMEDVILTTLNFDAYLNLTSLATVTATVINSNYLPY